MKFVLVYYLCADTNAFTFLKLDEQLLMPLIDTGAAYMTALPGEPYIEAGDEERVLMKVKMEFGVVPLDCSYCIATAGREQGGIRLRG